MSAQRVGQVMRLLGWLVIAAIVLGLSLDGRALAPGPLALVAAGLLVPLAAASSVPAVRGWFAAAAAVSLVYAGCALAPWLTPADAMGTLRLSQVVAGIGFACYCQGLGRWAEAGGWTQPARQLRWCAAFFVGVAVVLGLTLASVVAFIEPRTGPGAPSGFDVLFDRQLPALGSIPLLVLVVGGLVALVTTLAALAAMSTMSATNRQLSRYLLGTGPAPEVLAVPISDEAPAR